MARMPSPASSISSPKRLSPASMCRRIVRMIRRQHDLRGGRIGLIDQRAVPFNPASPYFAAAQAFYGANFANYIGKPALFYGALTDIPVQITKYRTDVIRLVEDVTAQLGEWDTTLSAGFVQAATRITYTGFVRP